MTDGEMAEEYVRNKADKGNFDLEQFGKAYFSESSIKQAYLAGLKAGRPKWHKVADGDLPKKDDWYLCKSKMWIGKIFTILLRYSDECFYDEKEIPFNGDVIAWCEIPKYTEE